MYKSYSQQQRWGWSWWLWLLGSHPLVPPSHWYGLWGGGGPLLLLLLHLHLHLGLLEYLELKRTRSCMSKVSNYSVWVHPVHAKQLKSGTSTYRSQPPLVPHPIEELQVSCHTGPLLEVPQLLVALLGLLCLLLTGLQRKIKILKWELGYMYWEWGGVPLDKMTRSLP